MIEQVKDHECPYWPQQSRTNRKYHATMPEHKGSLPPGRSGHSHDDTTASTSGGTGNNYNLDWNTTEAHHAGKAGTVHTKIPSKYAGLYTKKMFRETVEHQLELGAKLTLRGYLSRKWIIELSTSTGQNLTTEQNGHKWARTAISQFWKVTAQSAARTARKEELHREKTQTSAR